MPKTTKTNFVRITSWGPDGVRMDCEGAPVWVLEMAAMQLKPSALDRLIAVLEKLKAEHAAKSEEVSSAA